MVSDLAEAVRRGASAMVQSLGATEVVLRIPSPPVAGDVGEELGLRTPEFPMRRLAPVAVRRTSDAMEVLVPADLMEQVLSVQGNGAVVTAMRSVTAVQIGDEAFVVTDVIAVEAMGRACLYRLVLQPRATEGM
jgi:hypothetical protein